VLQCIVLFRCRLVLGIFIAGLVLSGVSALPLQWELSILDRWSGSGQTAPNFVPASIGDFISFVHSGIEKTYAQFPFFGYTTAGCLCVRSDSGGVDNRPSANGPLIYLLVEGRLDEAVEAARANGGKILRARQKIGEHGFRAVIIDSEGNRIALHTSAASL